MGEAPLRPGELAPLLAPATAEGAGELPPFDVFLSHNSQDKPGVTRIAERLKREGIEPWLDIWRLTPGGDWQEELAQALRVSSTCAVFVGPHGIGDWARMEFNLATNRMARDRTFRVFLVLLPGLPEPFDTSTLPPFLSTRTWVDLRKGIFDPRGFQLLISAIKGLAPGPESPIEPRSDLCPYRGLQPFDEEHAEFFFGREGDVQRLTERLKRTRFLAVLGPSGSGKSSLVRAGLLPALRRGALPGSDAWEIRVFTPGRRPLTTLAANYVRLYPVASVGKVLDELAAEERALHLSVSLALADRSSAERVVWVVDQLEEVFTLCEDETERVRFLENLIYAARIPGGGSVVVLTMRADFYPRCAAYPELAALIAAEQHLVSPMDVDGLRRAIEEPAWRVGLELEPGLVETILEDVRSQPGALPLLEHALLELWQRRRGGLLTLEGYRESGAVKGAIAKRADSIYTSFTPEQQGIARRILLRLTQPGEGTEDTRRRSSLSELVTRPEEVEQVQSVVQTMADARLLTTDSGAEPEGRAVEVSHEALIRSWPRLRQWIDENRQGLRIHRRLSEAAVDWRQREEDESVLYRGARLAEAEESRVRYGTELNELERRFVDASVALRDREASERVRADNRRITLESLAKLDQEPELALLLGVQAFRRARDVETQSHLLRVLQHDPELELLLHSPHGPVRALAYHPSGERLVVANGEGALTLWDAASGQPLGESLSTSLEDIKAIAFGPAEGHLALVGGDGTLQLWDLEARRMLEQSNVLADDGGDARDGATSAAFGLDGRRVAVGSRFDLVLWDVEAWRPIGRVGWEGDLFSVRGLAFSPDGKRLASADARKPLQLWDAATAQPLGPPLRTEEQWEPIKVAFAPDGRRLAEAVVGIRLWDLKRREVIGMPLRGHEANVGEIAFSPDGTRLASVGGDALRLWDLDAQSPRGRVLRRYSSLSSATVFHVVFSPDGTRLVAGDQGGRVILWRIDPPPRLAVSIEAPEDAWSVAYNRDGTQLASGHEDGAVRLWDPQTRAEMGPPLHVQEGDLHRLEFSPDGRQLAAIGHGTITLWDIEAERAIARINHGDERLHVPAVGYSPDSRLLATGGMDGMIRLWNTVNGDLIHTLDAHEATVLALAFSPDGSLLASGGGDGALRLWRPDTGEPASPPLATQGRPLYAVDFLSGGSQVLAVSDSAIILWDARTRQALGNPLPLGNDHVALGAVAMNPSRTRLALLLQDGSIRLWDVEARAALPEPLRQGQFIYTVSLPAWGAIAFSPDGRQLATAALGRHIRLWDVDPTSWERQACRIANRDLTRQEWAEYIGLGAPYRQTCIESSFR